MGSTGYMASEKMRGIMPDYLDVWERTVWVISHGSKSGIGLDGRVILIANFWGQILVSEYL